VGRLDDRTVLVSGGARGIGAAIARAAVGEGGRVVIGDVLDDDGAQVVTELGEERARFVHLDVTDGAQWRDAVATAESTFGPVSVLVNNAGIVRWGTVADLNPAVWHEVLRVNLTGVFLCCQIAARQMLTQGGGRIITTASINGFRGVENLVGYNTAKAGVIELTKTMAVELAPHNIQVNAIAPAQIDTRLTRGFSEDARTRRVERIPMGRFGEAEEVARVALFLASDDASYVTGHTLAVDGGYLAGGLWSRPARG